MANTLADQTGAQLTELTTLLHQIYIKPVAVQSNTARRKAALIGAAASLQLITTQISPHLFGREWRITNRGLLLLNEDNG